jgi:hypothetical protein
MSWQTYVDEHLMCESEGHHLTSAAIVGHDGTVWAQSAAFPQVIAITRPLLCSCFFFLFFFFCYVLVCMFALTFLG